MTQLHTIVARERFVRTRARDALTSLHRIASHPPTFTGSVKEMKSLFEDVPDELPEVTLPTMTAARVYEKVQTILAEAWDLMATRDRSNQDARADVVVDGEVRARDVPLPTLLSLEKALEDLRTLIGNMPTRDASKLWAFDGANGFHRAPEARKPKTRKIIKGAELSPATKEFPAQVQAYNSDEVCGHFIATEFSGAPSLVERERLVERVNKLAEAVKVARTEANRTGVTDMRIASDLLGYIFAP